MPVESPVYTKRRILLWEKSSVFVLTQIVTASRLPYQLPWYLDSIAALNEMRFRVENPRQMRFLPRSNLNFGREYMHFGKRIDHCQIGSGELGGQRRLKKKAF